MSKIQFTATNKAMVADFVTFHGYRVRIAQNAIDKAKEITDENKRFMAIKKPTKAQIKEHDEKLDKLSVKWANANKKVNTAKNALVKSLVPDGLHGFYDSAKFGSDKDKKAYIDALKNFLTDDMGLQCSVKQVEWYAKNLDSYIGVKLASNKAVLGGHEVVTMTKTQFNTLFVACNYEILVSKGVIKA